MKRQMADEMKKAKKMDKSPVLKGLKEILELRGAGYLVLIDPDGYTNDRLKQLINISMDAEVDAFLVGGSYMFSDRLDDTVRILKEMTDSLVILLPGSASQLSKCADGLLLLSLISGRNPQFLIEEHVRAAPAIQRMELEPVSTGYMLISSGRNQTAVEFVSGTRPIPARKPELAAVHALAAEFLGMKLLYLETGSGASDSVPEEMISAVKHSSSLPIIVGGGITTPEAAAAKVRAGADFIVTGNVLGQPENLWLVKEFAQVIHRTL